MLEKEKNISKETLVEAIENSLLTACRNHFGKAENIRVHMDPETCEYTVQQEKTVVAEVTDPVLEISLAEAKMIDPKYEEGDVVVFPIESKEFGRIATQNAKNVILQKIREEERKVIFSEFYQMERQVVTGIIQRRAGRNVSTRITRERIFFHLGPLLKSLTSSNTESPLSLVSWFGRSLKPIVA